ncbi:hypothetical protein V8E55_001307 [Tylopilus felleus]
MSNNDLHVFCNVQALVTNGLSLMSAIEENGEELLTAQNRQEYSIFRELLKIIPGFKACLMESTEEEIMSMAELIQHGASSARADDTKGMKGAIMDWITPKGQTLSTHIPRNWQNVDIKEKLRTGQLQVAGNQWPIFLYANYVYDPDHPWNGLLRSGLLTYKHVFTSPSSVEQEPKAMYSGNPCIHGMWSITKASIASIATQAHFALMLTQVFSHSDLVTDSEQFYNSILKLLQDQNESEEVDLLFLWWNRQIFPLYTKSERLPSKNSVKSLHIRQECGHWHL